MQMNPMSRIAVALAAADRGAEVVLVAAHVEEGVLAEASTRHAVRIVQAGTAAELGAAVEAEATTADVVVMAAAVADYRVAEVSPLKRSKDAAPEGGITLELVENADILAGLVRRRHGDQTIVGFAAETPGEGETLLDRGRRKAARKGTDLLAVNEVGWTRGFEAAGNAVTVIDAEGEVVAARRGSKRDVAEALWDAVLAVRRNRANPK